MHIYYMMSLKDASVCSYPINRGPQNSVWGGSGKAKLRDVPPIHARSHLMDPGNYVELYLPQHDLYISADCAWCNLSGSPLSFTLVGRIVSANLVNSDGTAVDEAVINVTPLTLQDIDAMRLLVQGCRYPSSDNIPGE